MIEWINFGVFILSMILMSYLYTLSVQPVTRSEKYGNKAWKQCETFRSIGGIFELVAIINIIVWFFYPIENFNWKISSNPWIGIIISISMGVPCVIIMLKGVKDAGSETLKPSPDTKMYGGIYNYIRHPQTLGEFPLFVAIAFGFNSLFLVIFSAICIVVYIPIMIHYEEQDLTKRFGEKYLEYKKRTGALFPKFWKH